MVTIAPMVKVTNRKIRVGDCKLNCFFTDLIFNRLLDIREILVVGQLIIDSIKKDLPYGRPLNSSYFLPLSHSWRV